MPNKLSFFWSPHHRRPEDYTFMKGVNPAFVKIMDGGPPDYEWVRNNLPSTLTIARDWAMSEEHEEMARVPEDLGRRHAEFWDNKQRELGFDRERTFVLGINEPRVWDAGVPDALSRYTVSFLDNCAAKGLHAGALQLSVGWPANKGEGQPPDWSVFPGVEDAIKRGSHALVCHEYWAKNGPSENWGWWGGRTLTCPWNVPIIIGECGVDMAVAQGGLPFNQRGWRAVTSPPNYAGMLKEYVERMQADQRFMGACVFELDYADKMWESFDVFFARNEVLANLPAETHYTPPSPAQPKPPAQPTQPQVPDVSQPGDSGSLIYHYPPVSGPVTQSFGENPDNYRRFHLPGHDGTDFGCAVGTPIQSFLSGEVAWVDVDPEYGNYVRIWHPQHRVHSFYGHLTQSLVKPGQQVKAGEVIALSGNTGNSTGPHLHFEIRLADAAGQYIEGAHGYGKGRIDPEMVIKIIGRF